METNLSFQVWWMLNRWLSLKSSFIHGIYYRWLKFLNVVLAESVKSVLNFLCTCSVWHAAAGYAALISCYCTWSHVSNTACYCPTFLNTINSFLRVSEWLHVCCCITECLRKTHHHHLLWCIHCCHHFLPLACNLCPKSHPTMQSITIITLTFKYTLIFILLSGSV